jgi:hypothetical protein
MKEFGALQKGFVVPGLDSEAWETTSLDQPGLRKQRVNPS